MNTEQLRMEGNAKDQESMLWSFGEEKRVYADCEQFAGRFAQ